MKKDLYEELGIKNTANQEEISKAYKDKAKELHPDKDGGDNEKMSELNHAYGILKNPSKRSRYDETGDEQETPFDMKFAALVSDLFIRLIEGTQLIKQTDLIERFGELVSDIIKEGYNSRKEISAKMDRFKEVVSRLESLDGDNQISVILNHNIEDLKRHLAIVEEQIEFMKKSKEIILKYKYNFDVVESPKRRSPEMQTGWNSPFNGFYGSTGSYEVEKNED